eukprot:TRINITY_DN362_c3_g4_i2.p1 TRINITY_DN362_c3_g4~~TRINITY_DN362_c3_g4_i2.p1  ORF type:complete len:359 (-),score=40.70 TRINITY_DN362_c3_g4_i2:702-1778(-)
MQQSSSSSSSTTRPLYNNNSSDYGPQRTMSNVVSSDSGSSPFGNTYDEEDNSFRPFSANYCLSSGPVWVAFVILLYTYYSFCYLVCIKHLIGWTSDSDITATNPSLGWFFLVTFNIIFTLFVISYLRCILTDPGSIPLEFQQSETERLAKESQVEAKSTNGARRYCQKCRKFKPDRCHHCSLCRRCILKMDHHCPWVNNCVGFGNYKFFQLVLLYTVLLSGFVECANAVLIKNMDFKNLTADEVFILVDEAIAVVVFLGIVFFSGMHIRFAIENVTTIETYEKRRHTERRMKAMGETSYAYINPYDIGGCANWKQVFGENPLVWFLPIESSMGNGCHFPVREDYERVAEETASLTSDV